ncbi:hypothetical protein HPP92_003785 [Vanilla planifolia]|nr:hypothetical protein HPP92_003785 [Vanilla planifolia]
MLLNLAAFVLGVLGLYAVFTVLHKDGGLPDFDSLHSWIGFGTMCLLFLQVDVGYEGRGEAMAYLVGIVIFLAVCSAATGFTRRFGLLSLPRGSEAYVLNFAGLVTILFGIAVVLSVVIP